MFVHPVHVLLTFRGISIYSSISNISEELAYIPSKFPEEAHPAQSFVLKKELEQQTH